MYVRAPFALCQNNMIEKPLHDHREYRHIRLKNNMEAIAVSDSKCDKASATMACRIGSLFDPPEIPGLAHFCEHMLFLGTEKYPKEDSYNEYLAKHGGHSNAYTAGTQTVYYFTCAPDAIEGAVDRFAQFFISPLFTPSATDREINAVNSEHLKNKQSDAWRMQQLLRNSTNPSHPLNRFSTGDINTLKIIPESEGIEIRQKLLDFHLKYYSANEMRLAVLGKGSLDELEAMIRGNFDDVVDKGIKMPIGNEIGNGKPPILQEALGCMTKVVPVKDIRSVTFQFMLPEQSQNWESKPWRYFSHLLGHEGKGSALSYLKEKSLATELSAGQSVDEAGLCVFCVDVQLTENADTDEGIKKVGETIFAYLRLLKDSPVDEKIWKEMANLEDINFTFRSLPDPSSCSTMLATGMLEYPVEKVMSASSKLWKYDAGQIEDLSKLLRADNMRVVCTSKRYCGECLSKDKYYDTEHIVETLRNDWRDAWVQARVTNNELFLAQPNPFVPTDLDLRPLPAEGMTPKPIVFQLPNCHVYYRQDDTFKLPKALLGFVFYSPFTAASCRNAMMAEVFFQSVMEELNEYSYDAECAGLTYKLNADVRSSIFVVTGYNDKVGEIMRAVGDKIASIKEIPQKTFDIVRSRMLRDLQNAATKRQPYMQAMTYARYIIHSPSYPYEERLKEFEKLRIEDFVGLNEKLFDERFGECLIQGNLTRKECGDLVSQFLDALPPVETLLNEVPREEVSLLDENEYFCVLGTNPAEKNSASVVSVQLGEESIELSTLTNLATQVLSQRYFDELRTKQQFGYIVNLQPTRSLVMEMNYIIQTGKPPWEATAKTMEFIEESSSMLTSLSDDDFNTYKQALLTLLEEAPKKLGDEWSRNWHPIRDRNFNFHRKEQQAEFLKKLTREEFNQFAESLKHCKRITSEVCAADHWEQRSQGSTLEDLRVLREKERIKLFGKTKIDGPGPKL